MAEEEEQLDIDLTDPELNKAATKIQASFRGHKVRKEGDGEGAKDSQWDHPFLPIKLWRHVFRRCCGGSWLMLWSELY